MYKKYRQESDNHLLVRQNIMFRAFAVNLFLVIVVWGLSFSSDVMELGADLTQLSTTELERYLVNWLAGWSIAGVVLFFVPAVATYWARFALRRMFD